MSIPKTLHYSKEHLWTCLLYTSKHSHGFSAKLIQLNHEKVEQFTVINHDQQNDIVGKLLLASAGKTTVSRVEKKQRSRNPCLLYTSRCV